MLERRMMYIFIIFRIGYLSDSSDDLAPILFCLQSCKINNTYRSEETDEAFRSKFEHGANL